MTVGVTNETQKTIFSCSTRWTTIQVSNTSFSFVALKAEQAHLMASKVESSVWSTQATCCVKKCFSEFTGTLLGSKCLFRMKRKNDNTI